MSRLVPCGSGLGSPETTCLWATAVRSQAVRDIPTFQLNAATGLEQMPLRAGDFYLLGLCQLCIPPNDLSFMSLYLVLIYGCKQCLIISSLALGFASLVSGYSLSAACHLQFKTNTPAHFAHIHLSLCQWMEPQCHA